MTIKCSVCLQDVEVREGDDISLCMVSEHLTNREVQKIENRETLVYPGEVKIN